MSSDLKPTLLGTDYRPPGARHANYHEAVVAYTHSRYERLNDPDMHDVWNLDMALAAYLATYIQAFIDLDEHITDTPEFHAELRVHRLALKYYALADKYSYSDETEARAGASLAVRYVAENFGRLWI